MDKFALLVDLGTIVVPDDHVPETYLGRFKARHPDTVRTTKGFVYNFFNAEITDENFRNPSCILNPRKKLHVCAFQQVAYDVTTSEERVDYLMSQEMDSYTSAQGAVMVFEQKRHDMPKGRWYSSFDEQEHLPFLGHDRQVLYLNVTSDDHFMFILKGLKKPSSIPSAFLGFREVK